MPAAQDSPSSQRALVSLAPSQRRDEAPRKARPQTSFVAQLIATAQQFPQTCERRRAETADVIAAYQATIAKLKKLNAQ